MKKIALMFAVICSAMLTFAAEAPAQKTTVRNPSVVIPQPDPLDRWSIFQIGLFPNIPQNTVTSNVYGVKCGLMVDGYGRVFGAEASWLYSGTCYIYGVQGSWVSCYNREFDGIQAAFACCFNRNRFNGVQASLGLCVAGDFQGLEASALNISGNVTGLQAAAICNVTDDVTGFQAAVICNRTGDVTGFQTSLVNVAEKSRALQVGLINVAKKGGFQFGLINYIEDGVIPFFPFINFQF